jgi:hypothetical protein
MVGLGESAGVDRGELAKHVVLEHSTFTWLLEPMLEHAGFEIRERALNQNRVEATYTCVRL